MKNSLRYFPRGVIWILLFIALQIDGLAGVSLLITESHSIFQSVVITGKVTDDTGSAVPGVSIVVKNTSAGTTTDSDGNYSLAIPSNVADPILVYTFIGYAAQEQSASGRSVINVVLVPDIQQLSEVVVVGYGTQKRKDLTGAIASVSAEEIKRVNVTSLDQALQGRAAGVQVTQASSAPGGGVQIRIRGGNSINASNEPLYVIDGIPIFPSNSTYAPGTSGGAQPQNALANINPGDIESMEVLKDASATAIYGSRGANGVIIITTKRGKAGRSNVDIESYYGVQEVAKKLDLLNATQFAELRNEADVNAGKAPTFSPEQLASLGAGTDWQDAIFRSAPIQNHQVTFTGGNEGTRFAVSGNYFDQKGIIINSGFQRGAFRANLDKKISEKFNIGNSLQISRTVSNQLIEGITRGGVVNAALVFTPTLPIYDANGIYTFDNSAVPGQQQVGNPVADANETIYKVVTNRILGSFFADYTFVEGLVFKVQVGMDYNAARRDFYAPSTINRGRNSGGIAAAEKKDVFTPIVTTTLTYNKSLNDNHLINILAGYESQSQTMDYLQGQSERFATDAFESNDLASGAVPGTQRTGKSKWRLDSWFGRANYTAFDRYIFTFTARADGSSRFGSGNKWAFFPSGAVKWRLSEENFIKNLGVLSDLGVRASYGFAGNQEIGLYQSLARLSADNYAFGTNTLIGYRPERIANPDLRWERSSTFDAGLDVGILENRITLTLDYYIKETKDLLLSLDLPRTTGYASFFQNVGSQQNQGFEFAISGEILTGEFKWNANGNIALNRNKILSLGPGETERLVGNGDGHLQIPSPYILRIDEPLGAFYGRKTNGIWQTGEEDLIAATDPQAKPGDIRYVDLLEDGKIDNGDRTIIGYAQPDFIYGFSNNFSFKNFDLSIFFQGVSGNSVWNVNRHELESLNGAANNTVRALERWTPTNPSNTMPSAQTRPFIFSDRQIEDGSFLRLRNITVGYNLPVSNLNIKWLQSARVYIGGQNLLTFTDYSGYDPEVNANGQNNLSLGTDRGSFPLAKMYTAGLRLGF
jgi:TonB-linked SusC/RagA family outer membrane protein